MHDPREGGMEDIFGDEESDENEPEESLPSDRGPRKPPEVRANAGSEIK